MPTRRWFALGACFAALAVAIGAFGAHGLREHLTPRELDIFETASHYHLVHAVGLLGVAFAQSRWHSRFIRLGGWLLVFGIVVFSGSLYALSITGITALGAITPFGGVAFIAGWLALMVGALRGELSV